MRKNLRQMFYLLALCFLMAALYGCAPAECGKDCLRVLFIGNSYTFTNDLPNTFAKLAASGNHQVETRMAGQGGWGLTDQIQSAETSNAITSSKWDYVIVQERSLNPAMEESRNQFMYPAARTLIGNIRNVGANPIFFQTWARRDGMPEYGLDNFESMQYEIDMGYRGIAQELNVSVAPVGDAWFGAVTQNPQLELWQADGSHPTVQGTYLAACVFYAVIFNQSPQGLSYIGNIPTETANQLQEIAAQVALP